MTLCDREIGVRLYLSSFRMGDQFDDLIAALSPGAGVAIISNAVDFIPDADRLAYARNVFDPVEVFRTRGFDANELDLRAWFNRPEELRSALKNVRLIWANGGNAFLLRRAMRQSGLDRIVQDRVSAGTMIYSGWSAGAVVAGPSLRGLDLMDDPMAVVEGYVTEPIWEGLALVDFSIVPHFQSDHAEAEGAARVVAWLTDQGLPFRAMKDGEAIVV
jgi:dipeptidase E